MSSPAARPAPPSRARSRSPWRWVRLLCGLAVLATLLWRLGGGPFLAGLRLIDGWALASAVAIGGLTTVGCAWRWSLVAAGLGLRIPLPSAVAHCYRAVFLNATLPGGVVGDVHRAVRHGRDAGDVSRGIRAVVWERTAGQVVQLVIALVVLGAFPSPVRPYLPVAALVAVAGFGAVALLRAALVRIVPGRVAGRRRRPATAEPQGRRRWRQVTGTVAADVRSGLLARGRWAGVALASAVVVAGHLATFLVAARTAGASAPLSRLLPLALLALLAMGLPLNVAGFGPREGVAAWAFGAAGLTAAQGVAAATVYGALVLVASLPGLGVLLFLRRSSPAPPRTAPPRTAPDRP